jgi:hypothetical protein
VSRVVARHPSLGLSASVTSRNVGSTPRVHLGVQYSSASMRVRTLVVFSGSDGSSDPNIMSLS